MTRIDRVKELFHLALEKDEAARAAFIERACGGDAKLREDVMDLLRLHEGAEQRRPPAEPGESAGDLLGPYKLLQPIGSGGFGVVWMAEQERPVRRKVALKIIKLGMDTKQVVARFEAERQALAMMDHENIAKVFDAGATERGRPYFVMELVKGVPITEYCDQAHLTTGERLELFQRVCHAVQHAHHKGIIHRDIKPSNVLVTLHDGRPVPKVIDFGVAKATDHRLTERTLFTEFRQIIGTPEYMSPEQAEFSGLDIDTRSDVYSLGVLLYELLTGTKPFDMRALLEKGFDEMLRHIREVDPPKPSTRVSTLGEAGTGIAQHRRTAPRLLGRVLRGDLDWICMRALEKDRTRRYGTASDFAADIGRYLLDRPIEARSPSTLYRTSKFVRRHRAGVAAAAVALVALVGGLVVAGLGWREAAAQREVAASREREARTEATRARNVVAFLEGMLGAGDPHSAKGADYTVRELLDDFGGGLRGQLEDEPEVAATLHQILANAYGHLDLLDKAEEHQKIALDLRRQHLGESHPDTRGSMLGQAWRLHDRGRYADAERILRGLRDQLADAPSRDPGPDLLDYGLADMLVHEARLDEARTAAEACVERRRARGAPPADVADALRLLARTSADPVRAEALLREALAIERSALGANHPDVATTLMDLGQLRAKSLAYEEAIELYRESSGIWKAQLGRDSPAVLGLLSTALDRLGRHKEAEEASRQALEIVRGLKGDIHPDTASALLSLGTVRFNACAYADAEKCFREALATSRAIFPPGHPFTARALERICESLDRQGRQREMEPLAEEALEIRRHAEGGEAQCCEALGLLGVARADAGHVEEGERLAREGFELAQDVPEDRELRTRSMEYLREVLKRKGDFKDVVVLAREIVEFWRTHIGEKSSLTAVSWNNLGYSLHEVNDLKGEEEAYRRSLAIFEENDPDHPEKAATLNNLGLLLRERGDLAEAETMFREALRIGELARSRDDVSRYRFGLGSVLLAEGKNAEAESQFRATLALLRDAGDEKNPARFAALDALGGMLLEDRPAEARKVYEEASAPAAKYLRPGSERALRLRTGLAWSLFATGKPEEADRILTETLATAIRECGEIPDTQIRRIELAALRMRTGRGAEAEPLLKEALGRMRGPNAKLDEIEYPILMLADHLHTTGRDDEAVLLLRELLALRRAQLGEGHASTTNGWNNIGDTLLPAHPEAAAQLYGEAFSAIAAAVGPDDVRALDMRARQAIALMQCGRADEAVKTLREVFDASTRARGEDGEDAPRYRDALVELLMQGQRYADAEPILRQTLGKLRRTAPKDDPQLLRTIEQLLTCLSEKASDETTALAKELADARRAAGDEARLAFALMLLGKSLDAQGKHAEAEPALSECLAIRRRTLPADSWLIPNSMSLLGECLKSLGRYAEAEPLLVRGYETMTPPEAFSFRKREALDRVVALYEAWGKADQAAAWRAKAAR
ncbi:MAG TPA: serine/threonine-protein kinase [Planctomycetota bacterium]|nr:serine/threonine-protein kinase [Planctomycetota bacterium]